MKLHQRDRLFFPSSHLNISCLNTEAFCAMGELMIEEWTFFDKPAFDGEKMFRYSFL
jgi:hypothetical protein